MVGVRGGVVREQSPSGKARFLQGEGGRPRARPRFWILLYLDSGFRGLVGGHGTLSPLTGLRNQVTGFPSWQFKARGDWDIRLERELKAPVVKFLLLSMCSQVQESQATIAPALASSSSDPVSAGHSTSRSQGIIEPMDAETQEDRRMSVDQKTGGEMSTFKSWIWDTILSEK